MKAIALLVTLVATVGFLRWKDSHKAAPRTPPVATPVVASADPWERAESTPREVAKVARTATWNEGLQRYTVHDSNVSARVAAGLNAAAPPLPTPGPRTMLDRPARR